MTKPTCPKCQRTNFVFVLQAPSDIKAVCRNVRRCGFRSGLIRDGVYMTEKEKIEHVNAEYLKRCGSTT